MIKGINIASGMGLFCAAVALGEGDQFIWSVLALLGVVWIMTRDEGKLF